MAAELTNDERIALYKKLEEYGGELRESEYGGTRCFNCFDNRTGKLLFMVPEINCRRLGELMVAWADGKIELQHIADDVDHIPIRRR